MPTLAATERREILLKRQIAQFIIDGYERMLRVHRVDANLRREVRRCIRENRQILQGCDEVLAWPNP